MWFNVITFYYGLLFTNTKIIENQYANGMLMGLIEITSMMITGKIGLPGNRKLMFLVVFCTSRVALVVLSFFENQGNVTVIIFAIAKLGLSFEFYLVFVFTGDVFPPELRSMAFGVCNLIGRSGGVLSSKLIFISEAYSVNLSLLIAMVTWTSVFSMACI